MSGGEGLNEVTIIRPHGLKVVQQGNGNVVITEQTDSITSLKTMDGTEVITKEENVIIFKQSGSPEISNSSSVRQSGNGNRVMIKQSGSGNSVSVTQSVSKKE